MSSCPHCGKTLDTPGKFCPECGQPLLPGQETRSPAQPAGETVIGVIGGLDLKRSFFKSEAVNLVITGKQTLCVPVATLLEAALKKAEDDAKAEGKWLIGKWKAKAEVSKVSNFSGHFKNQSPEEILREFPASIVISHADLDSITIRHRVLDLEGEDVSSSAEDWPITIKAGKAEYSFKANTDPVPQFRLNTAVDTLIGDKIRVLF